MTFNQFDNMPADARLWVYGLDRPLNEQTRAAVVTALEAFVREWKSHEVPVTGAYGIYENRFVLIAGYCDDGISGCSTDSSVRVVRSFKEAFGIDGLDRSNVFYRDESGEVKSLPRDAFQEEVSAGRIGPGTVVFDTTIQDVNALREGRFEVPFEACWHARAFKTAAATD